MYNMTCLIDLQRKCQQFQKWTKVKTWTTLSMFFLRFFDMTLQKT